MARAPMAEKGRAAVLPPQRHGADPGAPGGAAWWDKVDSKFKGWGENRFRAAGFRAVPGAIVRRSAYIAKNVVLMPSFVNVGARVDEATMIDTWATVGSCAQIGKNCHISGGAGIGGVLEPLQAGPVIIEDNCFVGARSEVAEGVVVGEGFGPRHGGVSGRFDQDHRSRRRPGALRQGPALFRGRAGQPALGRRRPSLYCAVIVKQVDEKTRAKTSINELLRD